MVELTFDALRLVEPAVNPVPLTATDVADVSPEPFTTTVIVFVVLSSVEPKSTVEPFVGDVIAIVVVEVDEDAIVAFSVTLTVLLPLVRER